QVSPAETCTCPRFRSGRSRDASPARELDLEADRAAKNDEGVGRVDDIVRIDVADAGRTLAAEADGREQHGTGVAGTGQLRIDRERLAARSAVGGHVAGAE